MDIAEIRKKAKSGRDRTPSPPPLEEGPTPTPQVATAAPLPAEPIVAPAPAPARAEPDPAPSPLEVNPLEALFNWSADELIGSEEGYRQGLQLRADEDEEEVRQWLAFSLGDEDYALDITTIREIIKPREITDIPRAPEFLLGIISLRGTIIPVFDLKNRLKLGRGELVPDSRIIVCQHEERAAGLLVDRIAQVVNLPLRAIEPPPAVLSGLDRELVAGVGRHQGKMMVLLQLSHVLDAELY